MCAETFIERPRRWDAPFDERNSGGRGMSDGEIRRALSLPLLAQIDASAFPAGHSLIDILRFDARIVKYQRGDIVVRKGDYGHSVFFPLQGVVAVITQSTPRIDREEPSLTETRTADKRGIWSAFSQAWRNHAYPEVRDLKAYAEIRSSVRNVGKGEKEQSRSFIKDVERVETECESVPMAAEDSEMVGEIAALTRSVRLATIYAKTDTELLEMRWQGLRDIRNQDKNFRVEIDRRYRERALLGQLENIDLFKELPREAMEEICQHTLYETYGAFEWNRTFQKADTRDQSVVIENEPVIAAQGDHLDGLIIIGSGFGRVSERLDKSERTIDYVGSGDVFGLSEIATHWKTRANISYTSSLRAIGYTDVLRVPTHLVEKHILPRLPECELPHVVPEDEQPWDHQIVTTRMNQHFLDFFINNRTINGTKTMLVNTDRCTNCDDCVRACAAAHGGNPRFLRHGPSEGNIMVANACMHCVDPVCLIGCPTGAIQRHQSTGNVIINDLTCIGCGTCANSCPYDNIRLVEVRDRGGAFLLDEKSAPIEKATKCDFCQDQISAPACERACPHDALIRVDMSDRTRLLDWLER